MKAAITSLLLCSSLLLAACNTDTTASRTDTVTVTGSATVKASPDRFVLRAAAAQEGKHIAGLKAQVDDQVAQMLALADDLDIDKADTVASELRISPRWQHQPTRKLTGYQVRRAVTFRVEGLSRYASLLEGLADLNIGEIHPAGAQVSNLKTLKDKALTDAVDDAENRARLLADAAGRKLGDAITISVQDTKTPPRPRMMAHARATEDSYRAGETEIQARVQISYTLE